MSQKFLPFSDDEVVSKGAVLHGESEASLHNNCIDRVERDVDHHCVPVLDHVVVFEK